MNLKIAAALLFACAAGIAPAQEPLKMQVFGGYSLADVAPCGTEGGNCGFEGTAFQGTIFPEKQNFNGWNGAASFFFSRTMGVTADFSGHYGTLHYTSQSTTSSNTLTYLFGPTWSFRVSRLSPFIHVLIGGENVRLGIGHGNGFSWAPGGGVDWSLSRHWRLRPVQFDYIGARIPQHFVASGAGHEYSSGFRYSAGLVFGL